MPGLYDISSNVANVAVSNTPGLYIGSGASSILNNAQQLLALLSNQGNVNFALASGNTTVQGFFVGNTSTYGNANVAAYLPVNSSNVAGAYFIGNGSKLTNLPQQAGTYTNANVAAFLPTYDGNIGQPAQRPSYVYSSFFVGDGSLLTNLPIPGVYGNANVAAYLLTSTGNISAGYFLGDGSQLTNLPAGTYGNANVAAYLPTYTGTLDNSSTIVTLFANAASQALDINTLYAADVIQNNNMAAANLTISGIQANLGAFQTYANTTFGTIDANLGTATNNITTLFGNAATQATAINVIDANLGTATTNITTLFGNAATQAGQINTIDANLGAFQTYANNTFGTSSYSNVQVAAFLPTYTGNIGNADVKTGSQNWYGSTMLIQANAATAAGGTLNLRAGNTSNSIGGTINVLAANITLGNDSYATDLLDIQMPTRFGPLSSDAAGANIATFAQGNVVVSNKSITTGNPTSEGGYIFVDNTVRAGSFVGDGSQLSNIPAGNVLGVATSQTQILGGNLTANVGFTTNLFVKNTSLGNNNSRNKIEQVGYSYANGGGATIDLETYGTGGSSFSRVNITADSDGVNAPEVNITAAGGGGTVSLTGGVIDVNGNLTANANVSTTGFFVGDGRYLTNLTGGTYGNTQVAQFLPTYTGGIGGTFGATNIFRASSGGVTANANVVSLYAGYLTNGLGTINIAAANVTGQTFGNGGTINVNASQIYIGPGSSGPYVADGTNITSVLYAHANVNLTTTAGNGQNGTLNAPNVNVSGTALVGRLTTNQGIFWANGTSYSTGGGGSTYGNVEMRANLAANSTQTTAWSIPFGGNAARPSVPFGGMIRYNTDYNVPEWYSNVAAAWYAFSNPVNIAPPAGTSMWYLAVGGGGAGGSRIGGGGGAGGLLTGNVTISTGTTYTITVGAGGASVASTPGTVGNDGGNTSISGTGFSTITAVGGGGGGAYIGTSGTAGRNGGSGGGGSYSGNGGVNTPGSGTSGQGSQGGAGSATNVSGGGGGGASAVGQAAQAAAGGNGGAGTASTITGASVTYAGGGGGSQATTGGTGGTGGGGNGSSGNQDAAAGTNFLGGGGGGARNDSDITGIDSGKGGDGVVIIRVANVSYSGSYTGSNVAISYAAGDTILKFSSSGTYTG